MDTLLVRIKLSLVLFPAFLLPAIWILAASPASGLLIQPMGMAKAVILGAVMSLTCAYFVTIFAIELHRVFAGSQHSKD